MKNLNITVVNKIATYRARAGAMVCGNTDYQITFDFDSDWDAYAFAEKTARFKWNGGYKDVPFWGSAVTVPAIENATQVEVGVYVEDLSTTTPAVIPCVKSIRSESVTEYIPPEEAQKLSERVTDAKNAVTNLVQNFTFSKSNNLFNPDAAPRGSLNSGVFTPSDTGYYFCTDFIKVSPNDVMTASGSLNGVREYTGQIYQYTSDKTLITSRAINSTSTKVTLTETTEYIRFAVQTKYTDVCLREYVDPNLIYEPYYEGERLMPKNFVAGRNSGLTAYEVAVLEGFNGTTEAWLESLRGPIGVKGDSAYRIAVANGFVGTEKEWLASLIGPPTFSPVAHHITLKKEPDRTSEDVPTRSAFEASLVVYTDNLSKPLNELRHLTDYVQYAIVKYVHLGDVTFEGQQVVKIPSHLEINPRNGALRICFKSYDAEERVMYDSYIEPIPKDIIITDEVKELAYYDGVS